LAQRVQFSVESERSSAVLPFEDLSPNTEDSYFAIGLRDEITDGLARLADVKVAGPRGRRPDAAGKECNLSAIGCNLSVRHMLDGNIRKLNGDMWISLRLVDLCNSDHSWSETYGCSEKDMFALETEITRVVAPQLQAASTIGNATLHPQETKPRHQAIYACNTSVHFFKCGGSHCDALVGSLPTPLATDSHP